jgi:SAM-dependent methyltransferase
MTDEYLEANRELWDELTPIHARSEFYDLEGFKSGTCALSSIELGEVGDVSGKSLLHLQCHFGMGTLSWARLGARAVGVDFSNEAINLARSLSHETGIKARFVLSNIYELPSVLAEEFDIVFTSAGVLCWLPDLKHWANVINHFLKPGGFFYIFEGHPFSSVFNNAADVTELEVTESYFSGPEPRYWEPDGDYADPNAEVTHGSYEWAHSLGSIVGALAGAGLRIEFLHEFPVLFDRACPLMERDKHGWWRLRGDKVPLTFSIRASKPWQTGCPSYQIRSADSEVATRKQRLNTESKNGESEREAP